MLRKRLACLMLVLSFGPLGNSYANPQSPGIPATGADLRAVSHSCSLIPSPLRSSPEILRSCMGYQAGVVTGFLVLQQTIGLPPSFCIPATASDQEIEQNILRWIGDRPERNTAPAAAVIVASMMDIYPCPGTTTLPTSPSPSPPQPTDHP